MIFITIIDEIAVFSAYIRYRETILFMNYAVITSKTRHIQI